MDILSGHWGYVYLYNLSEVFIKKNYWKCGGMWRRERKKRVDREGGV